MSHLRRKESIGRRSRSRNRFPNRSRLRGALVIFLLLFVGALLVPEVRVYLGSHLGLPWLSALVESSTGKLPPVNPSTDGSPSVEPPAGEPPTDGSPSAPPSTGESSEQETEGDPLPPSYPPDFKIPILMYHDVGPKAAGLTVTPDALRSQVEALDAAGYRPVTMDDALLAMSGENVSLPERPVALTFDDAYSGAYNEAFPILLERGWTATLFVITDLVGKDGYVTWDQIAEMADAGWVVGCHTASHPDLRQLGAERLAREVASARDTLKERTSQPVHGFCYPAGAYNDGVVEAVKAAGYLGAVTTNPGVATFSDPLFTLNRVRVDGRDGLATFKAKLSIQ